jgi:hypothetical protein
MLRRMWRELLHGCAPDLKSVLVLGDSACDQEHQKLQLSIGSVFTTRNSELIPQLIAGMDARASYRSATPPSRCWRRLSLTRTQLKHVRVSRQVPGSTDNHFVAFMNKNRSNVYVLMFLRNGCPDFDVPCLPLL